MIPFEVSSNMLLCVGVNLKCLLEFNHIDEVAGRPCRDMRAKRWLAVLERQFTITG